MLDSPPDTRAALLDLAETRLMQAEQVDRLGYLRDSFVQDAAALLRQAGHGELAGRLDEDAWGGDAPAVLAEVVALRERVCDGDL